MRYGGDDDNEYTDYSSEHDRWQGVKAVTVIEASTEDADAAQALFDADRHTFWEAEDVSGFAYAWVVFDSGVWATTSAITITALDFSALPKRCILQRSIGGSIGPFVDVAVIDLPNSPGPVQQTVCRRP
jgi:hypothetical protein